MTRKFRVGDRVQVKPNIEDPRYSWGGVSAGDIGVVKVIKDIKMYIDFDGQSNWTGLISEMKLAGKPQKPVDFKKRNHWFVYGTGCNNMRKLFATEQEAMDYANKVLDDDDWTGDIVVSITDPVCQVKQTLEVIKL